MCYALSAGVNPPGLTHDWRICGVLGLTHNWVYDILYIYTENNCTHKLVAAGKKVDSLCILILYNVCILCFFTGNSLRDEYRFAHTFDAKARDLYKVNTPSIVIFAPERFHSKYEPKRHVLSKVGFMFSKGFYLPMLRRGP